MNQIGVEQWSKIKASGDLPAPKGVALALMGLSKQEDVSLVEMARVIRADPAFSARFVAAANGIIEYGKRRVVSVQDALLVLSLPVVCTLALGHSLLNEHRSGKCAGFDYDDFWSRSVIVAVAAQEIARRKGGASAEEAYCLGLLSGVGSLALATLYPDDYSAVLVEMSARSPFDLLEQEKVVFEMSHAMLGAAMLEDWGMPRVFAEAVRCCGSGFINSFPEGSREHAVTHTLVVASHIGELFMSPDEARGPLMRLIFALGAQIDFDEDDVVGLCDAVARGLKDWGALLNINVGEQPSFAGLREQAVSQWQ